MSSITFPNSRPGILSLTLSAKSRFSLAIEKPLSDIYAPVLVACSVHSSVVLLGRIFPSGRISLVEGERRGIRYAIRDRYERFINDRGDVTQRVLRTAIPDNIALATALVFSYVRDESLSRSDVVLLACMVCATAGVLHFVRDLAFPILAPASRQHLPHLVGRPLSQFFEFMGPSDMSSTRDEAIS